MDPLTQARKIVSSFPAFCQRLCGVESEQNVGILERPALKRLCAVMTPLETKCP